MFTRSQPPILADRRVVGAVRVAAVVSGSLTHRSLDGLDRAVRERLVGATQLLVLDLAAVTYIDSAGLGGLVRATKTARDGGREVALAGLQREVRVLFEMMRLHELIDLYNDADEAVRAATAPAADPVGALLEAVTPADEQAAVEQNPLETVAALPLSIDDLEAVR